jgi:hypothetical protein
MVDLKLESVWFSEGGDGIYALYSGGNLIWWGDEYHDDAYSYVQGVEFGLQQLDSEFEIKHYQVSDSKFLEEMGTDVPRTINEIKHLFVWE